MILVYAVSDTLLYPFPAREPDGRFTLACTASVAVSSPLVLLQDELPVRFSPDLADGVLTEADLREIAP